MSRSHRDQAQPPRANLSSRRNSRSSATRRYCMSSAYRTARFRLLYLLLDRAGGPPPLAGPLAGSRQQTVSKIGFDCGPRRPTATLLDASGLPLNLGHHGVVLIHHTIYQARHGGNIRLTGHEQCLLDLNHPGFYGYVSVKRPGPDEVFDIEPPILKGLERFPGLRKVSCLQGRIHLPQVRPHDAQPRNIVIKRIKRGFLCKHADGFVKLDEHRLDVREHPGDVWVGAVQRLCDPWLEFKLEKSVHILAAGIDVYFDTVPAGIVVLERSFGSRDIALLKRGDGFYEGRPDCLDAGNLETLLFRSWHLIQTTRTAN